MLIGTFRPLNRSMLGRDQLVYRDSGRSRAPNQALNPTLGSGVVCSLSLVALRLFRDIKASTRGGAGLATTASGARPSTWECICEGKCPARLRLPRRTLEERENLGERAN